jgi:hypothetical protein
MAAIEIDPGPEKERQNDPEQGVPDGFSMTDPLHPSLLASHFEQKARADEQKEESVEPPESVEWEEFGVVHFFQDRC